MKFSLLFLISAVFIQNGASYFAQKLQSLCETDSIRGCKDYGKLYQYGDTWYNRLACEMNSCQRLNETHSMISVTGCRVGKVGLVYPECVAYRKHLNYPECCKPFNICKTN